MKEKRKLKRKSYFVNSAINILKDQGFEGFSARKVADETGYNVGSIYTYFKNLDHLENVASIYFTTDYVAELSASSEKITDCLMLYIDTWILFSKYSMLMPHYFYNVFFSPVTQTEDLNLFEEYYEIFEDEKPHGYKIDGMFLLGSTYAREKFLVNMCVENGVISSKHIDYVSTVHLAYFKSILTDIVKSKLYEPSVEVFQKFIVNFIFVLYHYVDERYVPFLDDIILFYSGELDDYSNYFDYNIKSVE